jgi:hypothetical protein
VERTDASPAWPAEDSFSFLNRAAGSVWERQRELLERWYSEFRDPELDLWRRFRDREPRQHYAAWWELYVHALFKALGFRVTVHPSLPETSGHPDFLVERGGLSFYVEAATVFSGIVSPSRESRALRDIDDAITRMDASTFYVSFRVDRVGTSLPSLRSIRRDISNWVASLDPDQVSSADLTDPAAWKTFHFQDWIISLRPSAWKPKNRGRPENRFIGMRTGIGGFVDDVTKLRNAMLRKSKRYGTPDKPLLVAVLAANGFMDERAVVEALFGSQSIQVDLGTEATRIVRNSDGLWISRRGAARRRISAVLVGVGILPHTVATAWPTLWYHFDPTFTLLADLPFSAMRVVDDSLQRSEATRPPTDVFGLPHEWPGLRSRHGPNAPLPAQLART